MRTNIDIDEKLLSQAMQASVTTTKRAAVEAALRITVQLKNQENILDLFGNVQWDGDFDTMRQSRFQDWGDQLLAHEEAAGPNEDRSDAGILGRLAQAEVEV